VPHYATSASYRPCPGGLPAFCIGDYAQQLESSPWATRLDIKDLQIQVYCDMAIAVGMSEALWRCSGGNETYPRPLAQRVDPVGERLARRTQFTRF